MTKMNKVAIVLSTIYLAILIYTDNVGLEYILAPAICLLNSLSIEDLKNRKKKD